MGPTLPVNHQCFLLAVDFERPISFLVCSTAPKETRTHTTDIDSALALVQSKGSPEPRAQHLEPSLAHCASTSTFAVGLRRPKCCRDNDMESSRIGDALIHEATLALLVASVAVSKPLMPGLALSATVSGGCRGVARKDASMVWRVCPLCTLCWPRDYSRGLRLVQSPSALQESGGWGFRRRHSDEN